MGHIARIHYEIDDDLHRRIKARAAMRGQTLKAWIVDALTTAADEQADAERERK